MLVTELSVSRCQRLHVEWLMFCPILAELDFPRHIFNRSLQYQIS